MEEGAGKGCGVIHDERVRAQAFWRVRGGQVIEREVS